MISSIPPRPVFIRQRLRTSLQAHRHRSQSLFQRKWRYNYSPIISPPTVPFTLQTSLTTGTDALSFAQRGSGRKSTSVLRRLRRYASKVLHSEGEGRKAHRRYAEDDADAGSVRCDGTDSARAARRRIGLCRQIYVVSCVCKGC